MDSISFENYRRVKALEDREYRRKSRKRLIVIGASSALLAMIIVGVIAAAAAGSHANQYPYPGRSAVSTAASITAACSVTRYPDACYSSISSAEGSNTTKDPQALFELSLRVIIDALERISTLPDVVAARTDDAALLAALRDCKVLFDTAIDRVNESLASLQSVGENALTASKVDDIRTWLSAAITDQVTCVDGLGGDARREMEAAMVNSTRFASNSLAIVTGIQNSLQQMNSRRRRLLASAANGPPSWVSASQRRTLLQGWSRGVKPNVTVAKDGTGGFRTINEALELVPNGNTDPFVIYIKAGEYVENVIVDNDKWNVTMIGDGMYATVVSGSLNFVDGNTTFSSATFAAVGRGFMAVDMGFRNSAGPQKHQAVALRAASDRSVFLRCSFDAFQDTLYAYALRQFYSECDIIGTVDFIFGDASAFFQNCTIRPRQPMPNQQNIVTAQGRTDPNQNTGILIQGCRITPHGNVTVPTYLGRPWKDYSTTIVMRSEIGALVDPKGWMPWNTSTVPPDTIYYAEYRNTGPGSELKGRVKWSGYRGMISPTEAKKYSVDSFIHGDQWIPLKGVEFTSTV